MVIKTLMFQEMFQILLTTIILQNSQDKLQPLWLNMKIKIKQEIDWCLLIPDLEKKIWYRKVTNGHQSIKATFQGLVSHL
jgi:hypothetical protein